MKCKVSGLTEMKCKVSVQKISHPGLGWLKDQSFHLLPYMAIDRLLVRTANGEKANRAFVLNFEVRECCPVFESLYVESSSTLVDKPAWKNTGSFALGTKQKARACIGTKFGFVWGF